MVQIVLEVRCPDGGTALLRLTGPAATRAATALRAPAAPGQPEVFVAHDPRGYVLASSTGEPAVLTMIRCDQVVSWS